MRDAFTRKPWLIPAGLLLITLIPFIPTLTGGFLVTPDDTVNFPGNPSWAGLRLAQLKWMFFTFQSGGSSQPLMWLTYAAEHAIWGLNAPAFHASNIAIHALAVISFYFLFLEILKRVRAPETPDELVRCGAAFAALLFAVHPLRVEPVAMLSARGFLMAAIFYALSIAAYLRAHDPVRKLKTNVWLAASIAFFLLSLFSRAIGVTLPLVLLVLDVYVLRRKPSARLLVEKLPFWALALLSGAIAIKGKMTLVPLETLHDFGVASRLGTAVFSLIFYLEKTLIPLRLEFTYFTQGLVHPLDQLCSLRTITAIAITAGLAVLRGRRPLYWALWLCYGLTLLPLSGVVKYGGLDLACDRWYYLASAWPSLFVVVAGFDLWNSRKSQAASRWASKAIVAVMAALCALTWRGSWLAAHPDELARRLAAANPARRSPVTIADAFFKAGIYMNSLGNVDEAIKFSEAAVDYTPGLASAHHNLGVFYNQKGRDAEALEQMRLCVQYAPYLPDAHYNYGVLLEKAGRHPEAVAQYRETLRLDPGYGNARLRLDAALTAPR